jgi:dihydropteroate synthase
MESLFGKKIQLMGILNVTPDSFYDGGSFVTPERALQHAEEMIQDGADILDIGGESSRPGSEQVSLQEEIDRVCPVVEKIANRYDILVSIDTTKAKVADECLKLGAHIINDISGLQFDRDMAKVVAKHDAYLVLMHMQGTPQTMQLEVTYNDLLQDIIHFFEASKKDAYAAGIGNEKIILDPGIGFGKSLGNNYTILQHIPSFKALGNPLLIGLSRKSLIGNLYNSDVDRLPGTIALNTVSVYLGADIIRVHDVKAHRLALDVLDQLKKVS